MILRTELKAVPHAGLGYHFLRAQVKPKGGLEGSSNRSEAKSSSRERRTGRSDVDHCVTKTLYVTAKSKPVQGLDIKPVEGLDILF